MLNAQLSMINEEKKFFCFKGYLLYYVLSGIGLNPTELLGRAVALNKAEKTSFEKHEKTEKFVLKGTYFITF